MKVHVLFCTHDNIEILTPSPLSPLLPFCPGPPVSPEKHTHTHKQQPAWTQACATVKKVVETVPYLRPLQVNQVALQDQVIPHALVLHPAPGPIEPFSPWRGTEVIGHYSWSFSCTVVNLLISQSKISCRHSPARPSLPLAQGGQHLLYDLADQWHLQAQRVLFLLWHPVQTKECNILVWWSILRKTHRRRKVKKHLQLVLQHQGGPPHPSDLQYPNKP